MKKIKALFTLALILANILYFFEFSKSNSENSFKLPIDTSVCEDKTTLPPVSVNSYSPKEYQASLGLNTFS